MINATVRVGLGGTASVSTVALLKFSMYREVD